MQSKLLRACACPPSAKASFTLHRLDIAADSTVCIIWRGRKRQMASKTERGEVVREAGRSKSQRIDVPLIALEFRTAHEQ